MKVLIIGGAGYVGGAVTDILAHSEHDVLVYDILLYEDTYLKNTRFVLGDVRDTESLRPYVQWADAVICLAAIVGDGACAVNTSVASEVNYSLTKWLVRTCRRRIIFMSTCSVYGARDDILDEQSPTNPLSLYAQTKLQAEPLFRDANAIIFRLGTLFGVSDSYSRPRLDLVVNTLTSKALTTGRLEVFGGDQYRPLLHVKDAAQAIVDAIDTSHTGIFNLHGENRTIIDVAKEVQRQIPRTKVQTIATSFEDARNYRVSSQKAVDTFGFAPQRTVRDGIAEVRRIFESHRIKDASNPRYSNHAYLASLNGKY